MTSTETDFLPGSDATYAVFVHLSAEKSPLYRAILRAFVAERARFALALRPSEIQAALATTSGPALPPDEVDAALRQLCEWGNLDDSPDTAEAASVEEFYRKRRLYQLSAAGEAAEQALTVFDEYLHRPGELQSGDERLGFKQTIPAAAPSVPRPTTLYRIPRRQTNPRRARVCRGAGS
jgi:hypothetical protein